MPLISQRPKLGTSRGQPHTTGQSPLPFSGRTLKRRDVLWRGRRALFANLRFWPKLRFSLKKKKKKKRKILSYLHAQIFLSTLYSRHGYSFPDCKAHSTAPPSKKSLENYVRIALLFVYDSSLWSNSNFNRKYPLSNVYGARSNVYANRGKEKKKKERKKKRKEWKMREIIVVRRFA